MDEETKLWICIIVLAALYVLADIAEVLLAA